jgi:3-phosphoshikimate 1-carboxyvinyltransferase
VKRINPFRFDYTIEVNSSKSHLQRALAISSLANGKSTLKGCDESQDVMACRNIIKELGCSVSGSRNLEITPPNRILKNEISIDVQESGLALRMFAFVSSIFSNRITIHAKGSLLKRPIEELKMSLQNVGLSVSSNHNSYPISIHGQITESNIFLDGSFSSQMLSGLLITSPLLKQDTIIHVKNLTSKPYVDLTIETMNDFGLRVENKNYETFVVKGNQSYTGREYTVEGDWSGAANHIVGAAITGKVELLGLQINSKQADKIILDIIRQYGASFEWNHGCLTITKGDEPHPIQVDLTNNPDLFPILAVLASSAKGTSVFQGTNRLMHKESNRLESVTKMLEVFQVGYSLSVNSIEIHGTGKIKGGEINCFNDHRIAMAATIAACFSDNEITVDNEACIKKSYPEFFNVLGL